MRFYKLEDNHQSLDPMVSIESRVVNAYLLFSENEQMTMSTEEANGETMTYFEATDCKEKLMVVCASE